MEPTTGNGRVERVDQTRGTARDAPAASRRTGATRASNALAGMLAAAVVIVVVLVLIGIVALVR